MRFRSLFITIGVTDPVLPRNDEGAGHYAQVLARIGEERQFRTLTVDVGEDGRFSYRFDDAEDAEALAAAE